MAGLLLCRECFRHFRVDETACPFCRAEPESRVLRRRVLPTGSSRSAVFTAKAVMVLSATAFVGCDSGNPSQTATAGNTDDGTAQPSTDGGKHDDKPNEGTRSSDPSSNPGSPSGGGNPDASSPQGPRPTPGPSNGDGAGGAQTSDGAGGVNTSPSATGGAGGALPSGPGTPTPNSGPLVAGMACPGFDEAGLDTCSNQADCPGGTVCSMSPVYETADRPPWPEPECNPVPTCDAATCDGQCTFTETDCGTVGQCIPNCTDTNCTGVNHCVDNTCVRKPCDLEGAADCSPNYTCDPTHPDANQLGCRVWMCDEAGAPACQDQFTCDPTIANADFRGCRRLLCDEPGGAPCSEFWGCQPDAENANYLGCVVLSCDEPGGPECDEGYACRPDARYILQGAGKQGCSQLTCDEPGGPTCGPEQTCDPNDKYAGSSGCKLTSCAEGWNCNAKDCAVDKIGAGADPHGCMARACTVHDDCACGYCVNGTCEPTLGLCYVPEILATPYGCVWPDDEFV